MADGSDAPESILDRDGEWELRMSIYRNGRRVAIADVLADEYEVLAHYAVTLLQNRRVTFTGRYTRENNG